MKKLNKIRKNKHNKDSIPSILLFPFILGLLLISIFFSIIPDTNAVNINSTISVEYYYQPGCEICEEKEPIIYEFISNHPDINFTQYAVVFGYNHTEFFNRVAKYGVDKPSIPLLIFIKENCYVSLKAENITADSLETWYERYDNLAGDCPDWSKIDETPISSWAAFGAGLLTGLSPCVILISAVLSSTVLIQISSKEIKRKEYEKLDYHLNKVDNLEEHLNLEEHPNLEKNKNIYKITTPNQSFKFLMPIFSGLVLGIFTMYILLLIIIIYTLSAISGTLFGNVFRYVLASLLFILGAWYIIDAFNEQSKLFKTPSKLKKLFKNMAQKNTWVYSYFLGFSFSLIKVPCVGAIFVSLVLNFQEAPGDMIGILSLFFIGLFLPILILFFIIGFGLPKMKLENWRTKARPYLRIISGLIIITFTIYAIT